ncbi:MAG: YdeI/OmpD-associated family protein [Chitinophagaceae bacterium]
MSQQSILEKLNLKEERNLLIQGLPSSIEKQFAKLSFAKNVTPLLKTRKIDWALIFAVNENQLNTILKDVMPALHPQGRLWIAYPKTTSKIASDLNRDCSWYLLTSNGFEGVEQVALDHVWSALWFKKGDNVKMQPVINVDDLEMDYEETHAELSKYTIMPPSELMQLFGKNPKAKVFFENLSTNNQQDYVSWISDAKKEETRVKRSVAVLEKLSAGKRTLAEK